MSSPKRTKRSSNGGNIATPNGSDVGANTTKECTNNTKTNTNNADDGNTAKEFATSEAMDFVHHQLNEVADDQAKEQQRYSLPRAVVEKELALHQQQMEQQQLSVSRATSLANTPAGSQRNSVQPVSQRNSVQAVAAVHHSPTPLGSSADAAAATSSSSSSSAKAMTTSKKPLSHGINFNNAFATAASSFLLQNAGPVSLATAAAYGSSAAASMLLKMTKVYQLKWYGRARQRKTHFIGVLRVAFVDATTKAVVPAALGGFITAIVIAPLCKGTFDDGLFGAPVEVDATHTHTGTRTAAYANLRVENRGRISTHAGQEQAGSMRLTWQHGDPAGTPAFGNVRAVADSLLRRFDADITAVVPDCEPADKPLRFWFVCASLGVTTPAGLAGVYLNETVTFKVTERRATHGSSDLLLLELPHDIASGIIDACDDEGRPHVSVPHVIKTWVPAAECKPEAVRFDGFALITKLYSTYNHLSVRSDEVEVKAWTFHCPPVVLYDVPTNNSSSSSSSSSSAAAAAAAK